MGIVPSLVETGRYEFAAPGCRGLPVELRLCQASVEVSINACGENEKRLACGGIIFLSTSVTERRTAIVVSMH